MKTIKLIIAVAGLFVLSGCASTLPQNPFISGTTSQETRPLAELKIFNEAMFRGIVYLVAPDDKFQEMIAAHDGDEELFKKASGLSFDEANKKDLVNIHMHRELGGIVSHAILVDKEWNLQPGDIIDYLPPRSATKNLKTQIGKHPGLCWVLGFWDVCYDDNGSPVDQSSIVLGVVCRDDESGCSYNSSPETQIGIGRRMLSAAEYRGVEAESQQPMTRYDVNIAETWHIPICIDCPEDEKITVAE